MKNSDLILKLKSLKNVNPDKKFLENNRALLLSQISNSGEDSVSGFDKVLMTSQNLARLFSKPVFALGAFVLVLFGANFVSNNVLAKSKPNDSLYIARIISEKVKVNTTFNEDAREKLALSYALRHAEDIASILSDAEFNVEENHDQVAKLSNSFIQEVNQVELSLNRLSANSKIKAETETEMKVDGEVENMIIADNSKEDNGIEIAIREDAEAEVVITAVKEEKASGIKTVVNEKDEASSSAENLMASTSSEMEVVVTVDPISKTSEAKELAEKKDYNAALDKLNEAVELINNK